MPQNTQKEEITADCGDEINNMGNNLAKGINAYFHKKRILIYIVNENKLEVNTNRR